MVHVFPPSTVNTFDGHHMRSYSTGNAPGVSRHTGRPRSHFLLLLLASRLCISLLVLLFSLRLPCRKSGWIGRDRPVMGASVQNFQMPIVTLDNENGPKLHRYPPFSMLRVCLELFNINVLYTQTSVLTKTLARLCSGVCIARTPWGSGKQKH